jgi:Protein of unknown function (DUF1351).
MTMELKIISPKEDKFVQSIEFNHAELKESITASLEKYEGLVYTDDTIGEAKKDRATLNKFKSAMDAKRKEIKAKCLEPYHSFEAKIKELLALVDKPMLAIDAQVKTYEDKKRTEKQQTIQAMWDAQESDAKAMVKLADVFDQRWMNVTYGLPKIEEEITAFLAKVEEELDLIYQLGTEFEQQVIRHYLNSGFNVAQALAENKKLTEAKAQQEEYKRQREAAKAAAEEARKAEEAKPVQAEPVAQAAQPVQNTEPEPEPAQDIPAAPLVRQVDFRVWATTEQLADLKQFLTTNGIKYGRVEADRQAA